jgi:transposase
MAYRDEYLAGGGLDRQKGKSFSLSPMCLQNGEHATGLIRLLSIGLDFLTNLASARRICDVHPEQALKCSSLRSSRVCKSRLIMYRRISETFAFEV